MKRALLFDLDETLVIEEPAAVAAFEATAEVATARHAVDVTNGASCLQREKLAASGLGEYFDVTVVSAEFGVGKPDASIFRHALSQLGAGSEHTVMVGDTLSRDVDGALAAGLGAVWVNRSKRSRPADRPALVEVSTLGELQTALSRVAL